MEWLRKLLEGAKIVDGKLDIEALMKDINTEFPKNAVPKETFNDINTQLKTANTTIADLKKNNADNETLQQTIKEHEATIKTQKADYEAKVRNLTLDSAIEKALSKAGVKDKYIELLLPRFNKDGLIDSDGNVNQKEIDKQTNGLKENYEDAFDGKITGIPPANPEGGSSTSNTYEALMANADKMTAEEVAAQFMAIQNNK
ncbi:phage scaffolding protein [Clostridium tertium]|uniref:phage scaffolding protein n=1 Tax=Clostridium tertium TaxID=1559 RepID=UPI00232A971F|nr:phage scaffolding protein [Clostridium tertium]MDB1935266.1 phage scaffolding protein [Clostridium tertium]MDB1939014.1 phage scaffolding protein [Clostridium tertium]